MCKIPEEIMECLVQVDEDQIIQARMLGKKWIVVKDGDALYRVRHGKASEFPKYFFGEHLCGKCQNLSGVKCQKVFDAAPEHYRDLGINAYECFLDSKRMEKYPFIQAAVEKIGCGPKGYFVVSQCVNYQPDQPQKPVNAERVNSAKVALAQVLWPDVKSMSDVVARSLAARGEGPLRTY